MFLHSKENLKLLFIHAKKISYIVIYILKVNLNELLIGKVFCGKERGAGCLLMFSPSGPCAQEALGNRIMFGEREWITLLAN